MSTILKALKRLEHEKHQLPERSLRERVATAPEPKRALPVALVAAGVFSVGLAIGAVALFLWPREATRVAAVPSAGPGPVAAGPERAAPTPHEAPSPREPLGFDEAEIDPDAFSSPVEVVELPAPPPAPEAEPEPAPEPEEPLPGAVRPAATAFQPRPAPPERIEGLPPIDFTAPRRPEPAAAAAAVPSPPPPPRPAPVADEELAAAEPAPPPRVVPEPAATPLERMARVEAGREQEAFEPAPDPAPVPEVTPQAAPAPQQAAAAPPEPVREAAAAEPVPAPAPEAAPEPPPAEIFVSRTHWHPTPQKRVAFVRLGAEDLRIHEGDTVGPFIVTEIEPSGVVFDREGVEERYRVSGN